LLALSMFFLDRHSHTISYRRFSEHSLPLIRYYSSVLSFPRDNSLLQLASIKPLVNDKLRTYPFSKKPHIILIILDSLRADHLPFFGYERMTTPELWKERDRWIAFSNSFTHAPATDPSFRVIFSNRYFSSFSYDGTNGEPFWNALTQAGYKTAFFTSAFLRPDEALPKFIGVKEIAEFATAATHPSHARQIRISTNSGDFFLDDQFSVERLKTLITEAPPSSPTVSVLFFLGTHFPYDNGGLPPTFTPTMRFTPASLLPANLNAEQARNSFDNSIIHADRLIAEIESFLEEKQLLEQSILILTADHGESFGERGYFYHATHFYNEQARVPILIRLGKSFEDLRPRLAQNADRVAGLIDLAPTILELAGATKPASFEGLSLLSPHTKPYELLIYAGPNNLTSIVSDKHKFVFSSDSREALEFDRQSDPHEEVNLWTEPTKSLHDFIQTLAGREDLDFRRSSSLRTNLTATPARSNR